MRLDVEVIGELDRFPLASLRLVPRRDDHRRRGLRQAILHDGDDHLGPVLVDDVDERLQIPATMILFRVGHHLIPVLETLEIVMPCALAGLQLLGRVSEGDDRLNTTDDGWLDTLGHLLRSRGPK